MALLAMLDRYEVQNIVHVGIDVLLWRSPSQRAVMPTQKTCWCSAGPMYRCMND